MFKKLIITALFLMFVVPLFAQQTGGVRVVRVRGGAVAVPSTALPVDTSSTSIQAHALDSTSLSDSLSLSSMSSSTSSLSSGSTDSTVVMVGRRKRASDVLMGGGTAGAMPEATLEQEIERQKRVRTPFRISKDTISAGNITLISLVAPGFAQIYNRQWWKMPVIYAGIGGFLAGGLITNNSYKSYKAQYNNALAMGLPSYAVEEARLKMRNMGAARTAFFSMAALTYLYSVADATLNYRGNSDPIRKTTTLAALFPGAGFIYTKTYWRLPIYYGAFAALATVIDYNNRSYVRFNNAYRSLTDNDPTTIDEFNGRYSADVLKNTKNSYRRTRDLSIIGTVAVYLISIVDAHVIATLKNWDVSDDLAINVEPCIIDNSRKYASTVPQAYGMSLKINF